MQHVIDGKQVNCLGSIQMLMKLCNHPSLVAEYDETHGHKQQQNGRRRAASKQIKYVDKDEENFAAPERMVFLNFYLYLPEVVVAEIKGLCIPNGVAKCLFCSD